jgi:hypothetical protein
MKENNGTENLKDQVFGENSNWITETGFEKLKKEVEKKFPEVEISKDSEFVLIRKKDGTELRLHRWKKFDYAPDGQNVEGERTIEQEIERFVNKS